MVQNLSFEKIILRVASFAENASGAKKKVSKYFIEHMEDIAFLTLDQIAQKVGISASTITRTVSEIGFKGFPDFQNSVQECIKIYLMSPADRFRKAKYGNAFECFASSLKFDRDNLEQLEQLNSGEKFVKAIDLIVSARNVHLCGMQDSYGPIIILGNYLSQLRSGVHCVNLTNMAISGQILDMTDQDVLLVVSLPRYNKFTIKIADEALERGCSLVSVTDNSFSSLGLKSTIAFSVPYESVGFFNSHVAVCSLLQALLAGINLKIKDEAISRLTEHNNLLEKWSMFKVIGRE